MDNSDTNNCSNADWNNQNRIKEFMGLVKGEILKEDYGI